MESLMIIIMIICCICVIAMAFVAKEPFLLVTGLAAIGITVSFHMAIQDAEKDNAKAEWTQFEVSTLLEDVEDAYEDKKFDEDEIETFTEIGELLDVDLLDTVLILDESPDSKRALNNYKKMTSELKKYTNSENADVSKLKETL